MPDFAARVRTAFVSHCILLCKQCFQTMVYMCTSYAFKISVVHTYFNPICTQVKCLHENSKITGFA